MSPKRFLSLMGVLLVLGCAKQDGGRTYTGILEGRSVDIPALVAGRIQEIRVVVGDQVEVGDTLAVMDTTELGFQRQQLEATRDELRAQLQVVQQQRLQAKNNLEFAQKNFERVNALFAEQAATGQRLDEARNRLMQAETAYGIARGQVSRLKASLRRLEAQLQSVRKKLADAILTSPVSGYVAARYFEPGEAAAPFQPVVEIIHNRVMEIKIYVAEPRLPEIRIGQPAELRIDGWKEPFSGEVQWISPRAEFSPKTILTPETRTSLVYAVKIAVPNPQGILKHGMPAEVILK